MKTAYPVFIIPDGADYLVYVPDLDSYTEGKSYADALHMARDLICLELMARQDYKKEIPEPSPYERAREKATASANADLDFSGGLFSLVDVDVDDYRRGHDNRTVMKDCTIPGRVSKSDESAIQETRYIQSFPGVMEDIAASKGENIIEADTYDPNMAW